MVRVYHRVEGFRLEVLGSQTTKESVHFTRVPDVQTNIAKRTQP